MRSVLAALGLVWLLTCSLLHAQDAGPTVAGGEVSKARLTLRGLVKDEAGESVEDALVQTLVFSAEQQIFETRTRKGGVFALSMTADNHYAFPILVTNKDRSKAAYISQYAYTAPNPPLQQVILKPWKTSTTVVLDSEDKPVVGAQVHLMVDYRAYDTEVSDDAGEVSFSYPDNAQVNWVLAYKDDVGLDYYENSDDVAMANPRELPRQVTLRLLGARPASVKVVDSADQPLPDVEISPWTIELEGKREYINLSGLNLGKTDARGVAHFRFLPEQQMDSIGFLIRSEHLHCPDLPYLTAGDEHRELVTKVWKTVKVRGRVIHRDGSPAAGIRLQGEGRGDTNMYFRENVTTQADGSYELNIYPDQATMIAVTDENFAATSYELPAAKEGEVLNDIDLELTTGFTVSGQMTVGPDQLPAVDQTATLIQIGANSAELVRWAQSNKSGLYNFRVGPGKYRLSLADGRQRVIEVTDSNLVFNSHVERLARGPLTGRVVDEQGNGVAALVMGESIHDTLGHAGFKAECEADGTLSMEKWNDRLQLVAVCAELRLFGTLQIEADTQQVEIVVRPAAALRCRVVDAAGRPLENCPLTAVRQWNGVAISLQGQTDADGHYTFGAVGVGEEWLIVANHLSHGRKEVKFTPKNAEEYQLPDIRFGNSSSVP